MIDYPTFELAKNWIPHLVRALLKIRRDREKELHQIGDAFGDPVQLAKHYIEPDCQQFNPADYDEDEERFLVREPIMKRILTFMSGKHLNKGSHLFLLGDAGMGKTSLLIMLKLTHLSSFWPTDYECVLMKLDRNSLEKISAIPGKRNTVLLLDALDEDPLSYVEIRRRIAEILSATAHFRRVIITCRTQFFSAGEDPFNRRGQVEVGGYFCPVLYLSLFNDNQIDAYCRKKFKNNEDVIVKVKPILTKMKSLRCRPLLLSYVEDLLSSDTDDWNEFTIYEALIKAWLFREQIKIRQNLKEGEPKMSELWLACVVVALTMYRERLRHLSHSDFEKLVLVHPVTKKISLMNIGGRSLLNKTSRNEFRFAHFTIQEFLIAHGIVNKTFHNTSRPLMITDKVMEFILA